MENTQYELTELKGIIPIINTHRNYWLVRTNGGRHFQSFYFGDYVGVNWDYVTNMDLVKDVRKHNELVELIKEADKDEKMPGLVAKQLRRFVFEMKKDDIVIIPSEDSEFIAFGQLRDDDIYIENVTEEDIEEGKCPFTKRRRVKWLKYQKRDELDPYLYKLLYSHHTITQANEYASYIDRTLYSFYIKDNTAHYILRVNETENIRALDLLELINSHLSIIDSFNRVADCDLNKQEVDVKINVQSPGPVEIYGTIAVIGVIGLVGAYLIGGGFDFILKMKKDEIESKASVKSDGLIDKIIKLIDHLHSNDMEKKKLEYLLKQPIEKLNVDVPGIKSVPPPQLTFLEEQSIDVSSLKEPLQLEEPNKENKDR